MLRSARRGTARADEMETDACRSRIMGTLDTQDFSTSLPLFVGDSCVRAASKLRYLSSKVAGLSNPASEKPRSKRNPDKTKVACPDGFVASITDLIVLCHAARTRQHPTSESVCQGPYHGLCRLMSLNINGVLRTHVFFRNTGSPPYCPADLFADKIIPVDIQQNDAVTLQYDPGTGDSPVSLDYIRIY